MLAGGKERVIRLTDVYYASGVRHNLISYGILDKKGYTLCFADGKRVVMDKATENVVFDVDMVRNVLVVSCKVEKAKEDLAGVILSPIDADPTEPGKDLSF